MPHRWLIAAAFISLTLIWGTTWAAIRIGLQGIPPFTGVAIRFAIASIVLFFLAMAAGVRLGRTATERRLWVVNGLLSFSISYGVVYWCEQWVPSSLGSVLFATFPLFVALLSHFALPGERLTVPGTVGVLLGFGGVALIFSEDLALLGGPLVARASVVFLLSPLSAALAHTAVKRWGRGIHPFSLMAVPMAITAGVMGALALITERHSEFSFDAVTVGALVYLAVLGSVVTFSLYYWLLSHLPATRVSLVAYAIPVVAVAVGVLFLDEVITARTLAGSATILLGVFLAAHPAGAGGKDAADP